MIYTITNGMKMRRRRDDKVFILTRMIEYNYKTVVCRGRSRTYREGVKRPYELICDNTGEVAEFFTTSVMMTLFKPVENGKEKDERLLPEYFI